MEQTSGDNPPAIHDEAQLVRHILDGHSELFRLLVNQYAEAVLRMVSRLIHSPEEAEEATQDALVEAYRSLARFDARWATFQTWLMRIAYHTALKHCRRHHGTISIVAMEQQWLNNIPDSETNALLDDNSTDRMALMERAIDTLNLDDQMLLNLYYFADRPIKEIASIIGRDEVYLYSRLQWIRKKLALTIKTMERNEEQ